MTLANMIVANCNLTFPEGFNTYKHPPKWFLQSKSGDSWQDAMLDGAKSNAIETEARVELNAFLRNSRMNATPSMLLNQFYQQSGLVCS